ncbi:MAG: glycosyl transferase, family 2 [Pseudonocardiales bacterium]|nr:glycosyl transferase, family 2 [Pseudonocardiales bacterium]
MTGPALAIVVSTIGRQTEFRRLMLSVHTSPGAAAVELVVVDQSDDGRCAAVLAEQDWNMSVRATTSARGASVGRNAGLRLTSAPVVAFPDDDAWYPSEALERIIALFDQDPTRAGVCGRQITADGRPSMLRWQSEPGPVTARNFLRTSIMSTMFFRRDWLDQIGPFDENMGVGSPSWYGACEESDLLLRVLEAGGRVDYVPSLLVYQEEPRDEPDAQFVTKMLKYGCGQGHLWRKRNLSKSQLAYYCGRKVVAASVRAARGERVIARADLAWLQGNIAGFRDVEPKSLRVSAGHR